MKLEQLQNYLAYNTECSYLEIKREKKRLKALLTSVSYDGIETTYKRKRDGCAGDIICFDGHNNIYDLEFKLHLRPLSDLTKEIEHNGEKFKPFDELSNFLYITEKDNFDTVLSARLWVETMILYRPDCLTLPFNVVQKLFEWHFDVFGLIKDGLAIDINTIKQ